MPNLIHTPVLFDEIMAAFAPKSGKRYIDATLGGAGHTKGLLANGATVLGIDQDRDVLDHVKNTISSSRLITVDANFMTIKSQADKYNFKDVDGILFDLGVSSLQLDTPNRGFSFLHDAPLDMRMNQTGGETAAELVNKVTEDELYEILVNNAQEPKAREIARKIVFLRPIVSTRHLAELVSAVYGGRRGKIHPATQTFQALRIAVNQELKILKPALKDAFSVLKVGGILCVISFHEGEDRIVKRTFHELVATGQAKAITKTPQSPKEAEIKHNPRSRSAKLRIIERLQ